MEVSGLHDFGPHNTEDLGIFITWKSSRFGFIHHWAAFILMDRAQSPRLCPGFNVTLLCYTSGLLFKIWCQHYPQGHFATKWHHWRQFNSLHSAFSKAAKRFIQRFYTYAAVLLWPVNSLCVKRSVCPSSFASGCRSEYCYLYSTVVLAVSKAISFNQAWVTLGLLLF